MSKSLIIFLSNEDLAVDLKWEVPEYCWNQEPMPSLHPYLINTEMEHLCLLKGPIICY